VAIEPGDRVTLCGPVHYDQMVRFIGREHDFGWIGIGRGAKDAKVRHMRRFAVSFHGAAKRVEPLLKGRAPILPDRRPSTTKHTTNYEKPEKNTL